jgi:hypothetical protein
MMFAFCSLKTILRWPGCQGVYRVGVGRLKKAQIPYTSATKSTVLPLPHERGARLHPEEMIDQQPQTSEGKNWAAPDVEN